MASAGADPTGGHTYLVPWTAGKQSRNRESDSEAKAQLQRGQQQSQPQQGTSQGIERSLSHDDIQSTVLMWTPRFNNFDLIFLWDTTSKVKNGNVG